MTLIDPNGNGKKAAYVVLTYRTALGFAVALIIWLGNQIWDEAKEIKQDVRGYALQLTDHSIRLERAERDIRDGDIRLNGIDTRVSIIEGRTR